MEHIFAWIYQRSPQGAAKWLARWSDVLAELADHPEQFLPAPENNDHDDEMRNVVFKTRYGKKYCALYVIRNNTVTVVHIRGPGQDSVSPEDFYQPNG